jgi:hypothetical protein
MRGCCAGVLGLVAMAVAAAWLSVQAISDPGLGEPPVGPAHGSSDAAIAGALAPAIAGQLIEHPHAVITLSEQDLTRLAGLHNPDPPRFSEPHVRIRDARLVVDAQTHLGPLAVSAVARVRVLLNRAGSGSPSLVTVVDDISVGKVDVPQWLRGWVDSRGAALLNLDQLLAQDHLSSLRDALDCVATATGGLRLGFHRPGTAPDSAVCDTATG